VKSFDKGSFIKPLIINITKASATSLPILRYSTCTFKGLLNKGKGEKVNLILLNIIIIKGFLTNIILKTLFYKKSLYIYSLNITLYIRSK
jgi:hypothetical protein